MTVFSKRSKGQLRGGKGVEFVIGLQIELESIIM